ncbi:hypothetical protein BaRGS_00002409, partial [Batillaria attramentaria]
LSRLTQSKSSFAGFCGKLELEKQQAEWRPGGNAKLIEGKARIYRLKVQNWCG